MTKALVDGQIASPADFARAQAQLEVTRAQLFDVLGRRALFEHAIATLIGKPASTFSIPSAAAPTPSPAMPPSVPSTLLERRPDIAAAERRVAAANASIGVARAAFFPRLTINLSAERRIRLSLLNMRNSMWSVGPAVTIPIFDGGARMADLRRAEATYMETVAHYRGSVLHAIQEVEDDLSTLKWLSKEARSMSMPPPPHKKSWTVSSRSIATAQPTISTSSPRKRPRSTRNGPYWLRRAELKPMSVRWWRSGEAGSSAELANIE